MQQTPTQTRDIILVGFSISRWFVSIFRVGERDTACPARRHVASITEPPSALPPVVKVRGDAGVRSPPSYLR